MDALSDVLRVIRLKGGVFLHAEFTAPWCISSQVTKDDCGPLLEGAEQLVLYHYVAEGRLIAQIPNGKPVEIESGEVVILPHKDAGARHRAPAQVTLVTVNRRAPPAASRS